MVALYVLLNAIVVTLLVTLLAQRKRVRPTSLRLGPKKKEFEVEDTKIEKSLNCFINHNGHMWDAHELLGVPAGCSMEEIEIAYKKTISAAANKDSMELAEAAYTSLKSFQKK